MDILKDWTNKTEASILKNYHGMGFKASGNFEKDIESKITRNGEKYNIQILGSYYTYWMENSRKPGKFPPKNVILQWIDAKGIVPNGISKNSLAYLIGRKIAENGTVHRPGVITTAVTDDAVSELFENIKKATLSDLKADYKLMFK